MSPAVRAIFADPWPEDVLASFLLCIARRLLSAPAAASYLLGCAAAVATVAPSRVRQEQLHAMWDVCLRSGDAWLGRGHQFKAVTSMDCIYTCVHPIVLMHWSVTCPLWQSGSLKLEQHLAQNVTVPRSVRVCYCLATSAQI